MAQDNQVSATLQQQEVDNLRNQVQSIRAMLPFLVNLTAEERRKYPKMGDKTLAFVTKALEYARDNQHLVPPYLNVAEFEKDMTLVQQLNSILRPLRSLLESLDDTVMLAGSESYSAALTFYQSVKLAKSMNVPGISTIYEDLQARFPGRGPGQPIEEVLEENETTDSSDNTLP